MTWKDIESYSLNLPYPTYLYSDEPKKLKILCSNPIVENMTGIWQEVRKYLKDPPSLSYFSPIWGNNLFRPGRADAGFKLWVDRGVKQVKDIYGIDGIILTFEELIRIYNIPSKHFFKYLQLRNFKQTKPISCFAPTNNSGENLYKKPYWKGHHL